MKIDTTVLRPIFFPYHLHESRTLSLSFLVLTFFLWEQKSERLVGPAILNVHEQIKRLHPFSLSHSLKWWVNIFNVISPQRKGIRKMTALWKLEGWAEETEFQIYRRGALTRGKQVLIAEHWDTRNERYCGIRDMQWSKSGGLAGSLFKKLDYEAPSSLCSVRQLLLYLPGLFCEKLSLKISRLG